MLLFAGAAPAVAQIQTVDPSAPGSWQSAPPANTDMQAPEPEAEAVAPSPDSYTPIEQQSQDPVSGEQAAPISAVPPAAATPNAVPRDDVFTAAEGVFGRGARDLGRILEDILRDQGLPTAYIAGQEAGGAFMLGVRYGSGTMHHQVEGDRAVYWTGPSLGFDVGGDVNKVFVLVYNLHDSQALFRRFPGAEGHAYFVGGFNAQYLRYGDVVLIPVRLGAGLRLGVNVGYMRFSERTRWLPF
jgi:hypothetical protein